MPLIWKCQACGEVFAGGRASRQLGVTMDSREEMLRILSVLRSIRSELGWLRLILYFIMMVEMSRCAAGH